MPADEPFSVPQISHDELLAFHQSHFSDGAIAAFGQDFMNPCMIHEPRVHDGYEYWEDVEDDLGYYEDGVKRTLTDEQIAIFRHSELRELRREQEKRAAKSLDASSNDAKKPPSQMQKSGHPSNLRSKKKKKNKPFKNPRQEPKPDLRKRTWDVVEAGLDSLDYD